MLLPFIVRYSEPDTGQGATGGASPPPDGQGNNQGGTPPAGTQTDNPGGTSQTFSQADIDKIVQTRLAEQSQRLASKYQKDYETKLAQDLAAKDTEVQKLVEKGVQDQLHQRNMDTARLAIKSQYGLSDAQVARLQGDTADALKTDAEAIYGAFNPKKDPPALDTGGDMGGTPPPAAGAMNLENMTPEQIRQNASQLWTQLMGG
jgi:hypothetical protein